MIVQVLNELIGKKYFQVWDVFRILTRSSTEKIIGGIQTSRSHGLDFRAENAIFADTIHMTHGTPENIAGSHPIV